MLFLLQLPLWANELQIPDYAEPDGMTEGGGSPSLLEGGGVEGDRIPKLA